MNLFVLLLISELFIDFIVCANVDIFLLDFSSSASVDNDHQDTLITNSSLLNLTDQIANSNFIYTSNYSVNSHQNNHPIPNSYPTSNNGPISSVLGSLTIAHQNEPGNKANLKLKKQKAFFSKKMLLWKRNSQRGYGAFLMLCEPDITCVTPQTKLAIANCMNSGGSALANELYNSSSNQNRIQCTDQDVARRLLGCLRLQSANNILITPQSRACVRQVVTLGTLDCFVKILRQKPKFRLGTRYSTISTDAGAVTAAGIGEGSVDGVEDPDSEPNGGRRMSKRETGDNIDLADESQANESILEMANDAIHLVTLNYDGELSGDLNKTLFNDSYGEYYSETNENYDNYDPFSEIMMDLKSNLTSNDTSGGDDDEFEEAMDGEDEDESVPVSSAELSTNNPLLDKQTNRTSKPVQRSKRQCRHNRRYHNRRNRPRDRSGRAHRRTHDNNFREENQDLREEYEDERKWEMLGKQRG